MGEKVQACNESKKEGQGRCAAQEGDTVVAVHIFEDLDRKESLMCNERRYRDQMKRFSLGNLSTHDD